MWGPVVQYTDLSGTAQSSCYDCSEAPQQDSARTGADSAQWSMAPAEDQTRHPQASELSYSAPPLRVTLLTVDMVGFCLFEPRKEELWTWTFVTYPVNWNVPIKASLFPSEGVTALSLVDRMSRSWHLWLSQIKQQGAHQCAHCLQSTWRILLLSADGWVGEDGLWPRHDECGSLMSHLNFVVGTKASCSRF